MDKKYLRRGSISPIIIIGLIVVLLIGGYILGQTKKQKTVRTDTPQGETTQSQSQTQSRAKTSLYRFNGQNWQGQVAKNQPCYDNAPLSSSLSPDLAKATAKLYPGQERGGDYKAHGGLSFDNITNNVTITLPATATLYEGSRYLEMGEEQILIDLQTDCGWLMRFDHLAKVGPDLASSIAALPAPLPDQSQTHPISPLRLEAGTVIATEVGFKELKRTTVDFGLYDLKKPNAVSQTAAWQAAHPELKQLGAHGVCWFDYLVAADQAIVKALPAGDSNAGAQSDYCH